MGVSETTFCSQVLPMGASIFHRSTAKNYNFLDYFKSCLFLFIFLSINFVHKYAHAHSHQVTEQK